MGRDWNDNRPTHNEGYGPKPAVEAGIRRAMREEIFAPRPRLEPSFGLTEARERERRLQEAALGLDKFRQHVVGLSGAERQRMLGRLKPSDELFSAKREILLEAGAAEGIAHLEGWCDEQRKLADAAEQEYQRRLDKIEQDKQKEKARQTAFGEAFKRLWGFG